MFDGGMLMSENGTTFRCTACGKEFKAAWDDKEAWAETRQIFGEDPGPCFVVCDECWRPVARREGWVK
jgi:hypothetical protein